ncbi:MAG: tRNA epoxyqueuosine(34) reductase QueG [Clostridia bacterium]|nr:tRNA epoxyqueuosine(34) reductase QueG [Clostridia bacterium]
MLSADLVKGAAFSVGFDLVGITDAGPLTDLGQLLRERRESKLESPFITAAPEERVNPELFLPGARSIIMVGLSYYTDVSRRGGRLRGLFSRSAWGRDYHRVLGERLSWLGQLLKGFDPGLIYRPFVDTGPLPERELARRAGLGWIGKNTALINDVYGSWIFLGGMVMNRELETDSPVEADCGECDRCLKACPAGAIEKPYLVNPHRCLSYLTQKKGFLAPAERVLLGNRLYGCDTCQEVCPKNAQVKRASLPDFSPPGEESLSLEELLCLTGKEFTDRFGHSAAAWRGKTTLQRNAIIALGNSGDPAVISLLIPFLEHSNPVLRGHGAWALGKLGSLSAEKALSSALEKEKEEKVREEIRSALNTIRRHS